MRSRACRCYGRVLSCSRAYHVVLPISSLLAVVIQQNVSKCAYGRTRLSLTFRSGLRLGLRLGLCYGLAWVTRAWATQPCHRGLTSPPTTCAVAEQLRNDVISDRVIFVFSADCWSVRRIAMAQWVGPHAGHPQMPWPSGSHSRFPEKSPIVGNRSTRCAGMPACTALPTAPARADKRFSPSLGGFWATSQRAFAVAMSAPSTLGRAHGALLCSLETWTDCLKQRPVRTRSKGFRT